MNRRNKPIGNYVRDPNCPGALMLVGTAISVHEKNSLKINSHSDEIAELKKSVENLSKIVQHLLNEKGETDNAH